MSMLNLLFAWEDFYTSISPGRNRLDYRFHINYNKPKAVYVFRCSFQDLFAPNYGGAIKMENTTQALIEYSNFINCSASDTGGSLYFYSNKGEIVLKSVCALESLSNNSIHFMDSTVRDSVNSKNCILYSSIAGTYSEKIETTIQMRQGLINFEYDNISNSITSNNCIFNLAPTKDNSSICSRTSFSTFKNNTSKNVTIGARAISIWISRTKKEFDTCNIIDNNCEMATGIIYTQGFINIKNSYINNNNKEKNMFYIGDGEVILNNCTIDNTEVSNNSLGKLIISNKPSKPFVNNIKIYGNEFCSAKETTFEIYLPTFDDEYTGKNSKMIANFPHFLILILLILF